jgi:hypothetical protein
VYKKIPPTVNISSTDIAFLHIGKNAGTQITHLARQIEESVGLKIVNCGHETKLYMLPEDARYFFSIRNPVSRYKSGFYSRKRKGQPRIYNEWTEHEHLAFSTFEHANDLAESLFRNDKQGREATQAIGSISHTSRHQIDWFQRTGQFFTLNPPLWIIRQEYFDDDFSELLNKSNIALSYSDLKVSEDAMTTHKNDYTEVPKFSDLAITNLKRWYARDFVFYELCESWMNSNRGND